MEEPGCHVVLRHKGDSEGHGEGDGRKREGGIEVEIEGEGQCEGEGEGEEGKDKQRKTAQLYTWNHPYFTSSQQRPTQPLAEAGGPKISQVSSPSSIYPTNARNRVFRHQSVNDSSGNPQDARTHAPPAKQS